MAESYQTTTQHAGPVNVVFQRTLLQTAKQCCPYFAGTVPANLTKQSGSFTAKFRRIENLTPSTSALSELSGSVAFPTGRTSVQPTVTDITKAVSKYGQHIVITEEVDLVNFNGETDAYMARLGHAAGRSLNQVQRNEIEDNATAILAGGAASVGAINSAVVAGDLKNLINALARQDALPFSSITLGDENIGTNPILPAFWGVCHPDAAMDLVGLSGFKSVETYASQTPTLPGEFGLYQAAGYGIRFLQSTDASIDTGTGAAVGSTGLRSTSSVIDTYPISVWGQDAVGAIGFGMKHIQEAYKAGDNLPAVELIFKPRGSAGAADPYNEVSTMAYKTWSAAKVLNSNWCRSLTVGATSL